MLVPMKKVMLIFLKEDKQAMLQSIQRGGQLMIIEPEENANAQTGLDQSKAKLEQAQAMLSLLDSVAKKNSFFVDRPKISYDDFMKTNEKGQQVSSSMNQISEEMMALQTKVAQAESLKYELEPWLKLDVPTKELISGKYVTIVTGFVQDNTVDQINALIAPADAEITYFGNAPEGIACMIAAYSEDSQELIDSLKEAGFTEAQPPQTDVVPMKVYEAQTKLIDECNQKTQELHDKMVELGADRDELELLIQQMKTSEQVEQVAYTDTIETVTIQGWIREDRQEKLKADIERVSPYYLLEFSDPAEGEQPPTVTQNPKFLAQFETITDMFSLPKPGTIDPAPIAGPWYWVIFGMMIGDVGYGLVTVIAAWLFRKIKKPQGSFAKLVNVIYYSSYMSIFWGIIFGSYFGETWNPILFNPLDNPMGMLIFTMIVGVLQIFSGMGIKIAEQVKAGRLIDALCDQVSWMVLILGIGLMFLSSTATIGKWMAIIGALVILLTAGREKKGIVGKAVGGLLGLYNITSYLSDILSYSRILALALATGVVGMVMNLLAGMVATNPIGYIFAVLILLVGHVFNLAMSTLSAYVHDSRLEYIEFFNQFYEGGGLPFKPLEVNEEYYDVLDADHPQGSNSVGPEHISETK